MILTEQEQSYLKAAFDTAIKHSPDSIAAASVLIPLLQKIVSLETEQPCQP